MISHPAAGWRIRPYRHVDAPRCRRIFEQALETFVWRGEPEPYLHGLADSLHRARSWVAEEQNAGVVGFLTMLNTRSYVDHVFVHEDWRFCGVGRGLLEIARLEADEPLELDVDDQNINGRRAYHALGWVETGKRSRNGNIRMRSP